MKETLCVAELISKLAVVPFLLILERKGVHWEAEHDPRPGKT